ncbi:MAG: metallophosphoesterase [Lachnospiraceae bacterium]|nr:metallophosphoesterase [Lachnospiraceae bacterium]
MIVFLSCIGILILFFLAVMAVDCHRFVVRNYLVETDMIKKDLVLVLLADLHSRTFGKENEKLKKAIENAAPDIVLCGGDLINASLKDDGKAGEDLLSFLGKRYPVFHVNGNHEMKIRRHPDVFRFSYEDYREKAGEAGVRFLENESVFFEETGVRITGLELPPEYYDKRKKISLSSEELIGMIGLPQLNCFEILLTHDPEYFEAYAGWGADLTLSGHVHGGLMRLPGNKGFISPRLRLFPKYSGGLYRCGDSRMVLSCGLGFHTLPLRIFNPGELSVIKITSKTSVF